MGLDVGTKTIGIALSDELYLIAHSHLTWQRKAEEEDLAFLSHLAGEKEVKEIIIGLPKHMNNQQGPSARRAQTLGAKLETMGFAVYYQDERLSTKSAEDILIKSKVRREHRKKVVDALAAGIILQTWLDKKRTRDAGNDQSV